MEFALKADPNEWTSEAVCLGRRVEIHVDREVDELRVNEVSTMALRSIDQQWSDIREALLDHPFHLYNQAWSDPAQGFSRLDPEAFLDKLSLTDVYVGDSCLTLYFSDGGLFAGHTVSVTLIEGYPMVATLEG